ncbi:MAG: hypothetical protein WAL98_17275 [Desulfatiglandaceae bacterium]|jgi:hypothetical protein
MKKLFKELLDMEEVMGLMLLSFEGEFILHKFVDSVVEKPENMESWGLFIHSLKGAKEVEILFQDAKIYIRKTVAGYLFVMVHVSTPMAMLRLNCDLALFGLKQIGKNRLSRSLLRGR